jgi:hypothetical protein
MTSFHSAQYRIGTGFHAESLREPRAGLATERLADQTDRLGKARGLARMDAQYPR